MIADFREEKLVHSRMIAENKLSEGDWVVIEGSQVLYRGPSMNEALSFTTRKDIYVQRTSAETSTRFRDQVVEARQK